MKSSRIRSNIISRHPKGVYGVAAYAVSFLLLIIFSGGFPLSASDFNDKKTPFQGDDPPKINIRAGYEYLDWFPYKSDKLDYHIRKNQLGYFDISLFPGSFTPVLGMMPNLCFHWETNFNGHTQSELMVERGSDSLADYAYNKLRSSIDLFMCEEDDRNPTGWVQVEYTVERFSCSVTPAVSSLNYQPFKGTPRTFSQGQVITQYVDFHEISLTFNTMGYEVLIGIIGALTGGDSSVAKIIDLRGIADTRLGLFFAQFHKPYEIEQYTGTGSTGEENTIYNARFRTVGLVEKIKFKPFRIFYMGYIPRFGLTFVDLKEGTALRDPEAPLFFYYAHELEMGFNIGTDRYAVRIIGSFDYTFMVGGDLTTNDDTGDLQVESSSFINDDILIKLYATADLWF